MMILALEFSSPRRSVAVVEADARAATVRGQCQSVAGHASLRSSDALDLVAGALRQAGLEREQIERVAIGLGPGSYAGIRAAIALAQGWQLARHVELLGLGSVECLAAQAQAEGLRGRVEVVIDAQRNEFCAAAYDLGATDRRELEPLRLQTLAQIQRRQAAGMIIGPEVPNWFPGSRLVFPQAATLGQLAAGLSASIPGAQIAPIYLRETKFVKAPAPRWLAP